MAKFTSPINRCSICGTDVANQKSTKDAKGNYYCNPCWLRIIQRRAPQTVVPSAARMSSGHRTTEPEHERPDDFEKKIITRCVVGCVLVVVLVVSFFLINGMWETFRDKWENANRENLIALKTKAEALTRSGQVEEANSKYDELFRLLGKHQVRDSSLQDELTVARNAADRVGAIVAARQRAAEEVERRRQEEERRKQEIARQAQEAIAQKEQAERAKVAEAAAKVEREKEIRERLAYLVDHDPVLSSFINEFPEFEQSLKDYPLSDNDVTRMESHIKILLASEKITLRKAQYLMRYLSKVREGNPQ